MLSILLSACLIADPTQCKDFQIPVDFEGSALQCSMVAPPYFVRWMEEHPEWRVQRWKCVPLAVEAP